jgi:hypothetical protein
MMVTSFSRQGNKILLPLPSRERVGGEGDHRVFPLPSIPSRQERGDFLEFWLLGVWNLFGIWDLEFGI